MERESTLFVLLLYMDIPYVFHTLKWYYFYSIAFQIQIDRFNVQLFLYNN